MYEDMEFGYSNRTCSRVLMMRTKCEAWELGRGLFGHKKLAAQATKAMQATQSQAQDRKEKQFPISWHCEMIDLSDILSLLSHL